MLWIRKSKLKYGIYEFLKVGNGLGQAGLPHFHLAYGPGRPGGADHWLVNRLSWSRLEENLSSWTMTILSLVGWYKWATHGLFYWASLYFFYLFIFLLKERINFLFFFSRKDKNSKLIYFFIVKYNKCLE